MWQRVTTPLLATPAQEGARHVETREWLTVSGVHGAGDLVQLVVGGAGRQLHGML